MVTAAEILRYAIWLEEIDPSFLPLVIRIKTGEDYRDRDLLDRVARLVEIFGLHGAAQIIGCPSA